MSPLNITQPLGIWSINVYNGYYKVMSNIPKMGHLPTPDVVEPVVYSGGLWFIVMDCVLFVRFIDHNISSWSVIDNLSISFYI